LDMRNFETPNHHMIFFYLQFWILK